MKERMISWLTHAVTLGRVLALVAGVILGALAERSESVQLPSVPLLGRSGSSCS